MASSFEHKPLQIQYRPPHSPHKVPLFLIHDGSGTLFSYLSLGDLDRDTYGIADPYFGDDRSWEGGLREMANLYVSFITSVVSTGSIFLGGWSLGGLIALEISHLLRNQTQLHILGLIMIDSPFTQDWRNLRRKMAETDPRLPDHTSLKIRQSVKRRFQESKVLIDGWDIPQWENKKESKDYSYHPWNIASYPITINADKEQAGSESSSSQVAKHAQFDNLSPPPAILIRASKHLGKDGAAGLIDVDVSRDSKLLGWESYPYDFIKYVYDVPCDHYDMFDADEMVLYITKALKSWCEERERMTS